MKMTKLGKALFMSLSAASTVLAADSALPAAVGNATHKNFKKDEVKAKILALDSDLDPQQVDGILDSILDIGTDPTPKETPQAAADEGPADKIRSILAGKVDDATIAEICGLIAPAGAADEDDPDMVKKEDVTAAMDGLRKELREAEDARNDVRDVVGNVYGMDSAEAVYGFALDHMKVDHEGVTGAKALRALFKVASANKASTVQPTIAQDAAGAETMFPGLARIGAA